MKNINITSLLLLLLCCNCRNQCERPPLVFAKKHSVTQKEENVQYNKNIDSILQLEKEQYPTLIYKENNIEYKIFRYGEVGEYAGIYSDVELGSNVFYLKILKNNRVIDSLEIYKEEIGENVIRIKKIKLLDNKNIIISVSETWEDRIGEESKVDSLYIYKIGGNNKLNILDKKEVYRNIK